MNSFEHIKEELRSHSLTWLITGASGFIGSNLLEELLKLNQKVIGLDNFSTGSNLNLEKVQESVLEIQWKNFTFIEGDLCDLNLCKDACNNVDHILHQAALGSVPRSIVNPIDSNRANVTGFLNILDTAMRKEIKSFTYASSSSVYGDHPDLPKVESKTGNPLSPYALTKAINESFSSIFFGNYGYPSIGLRYFNVFGRRQDPDGDYAAVMPRWISSMIANKKIQIFGDGSSSRDFCFIDNVVQANIISALSSQKAKNQVYNVAFGEKTALIDLFKLIQQHLKVHGVEYSQQPEYLEFREGDIKHSLADISKAKSLLGYNPQYNIHEGISKTVEYYLKKEI